ncbi:N-acetylglucosaminyl-diphospho-decaprenol L-rhamnosyltransferase [Labedella gwakjiensis]|uniref:N-acetylglucosaminyl-diphospho-decaprenol L-rhamnosyltransferase n=1 Tax=Labedella gwakjiensis TaxID=390269 RepID=A0A2P8GXT4_9MICO|nr:glycosyltransferase family 2 protein [Labedella gwakjiensis]PSL38786.1 N-acetylglucosaminyl-diphospho-decaprenol L-rhamnosyltransferase [Labedella gwakjiensis]
MSAITVLTVTHNSSSILEGFLSSVERSSTSDVDVVIVDSGSTEAEAVATERIASSHDAVFRRMERNAGYGAGINAAARLASDAELLLICNPDVELGEGSLDILADRLRSDRTIGAVGPRILNLDGTVYPSARRLPSTRLGIGHAIFANVWTDNPWSRRYRNADALGTGGTDVGWLSGACLLMRAEDFVSLGGFDEGFFMYFEDVDLGRRIGLHGLRNVYVPDAVVRHIGGHSTEDVSAVMLQAHHRSAYRYFAIRHPEWYLAPARLVVRAGLGVRSAWASMRSRRTDSRRSG